MKVDFKFHPVGFGLFSSGRIGNFRYVYDCGQLHRNDRVNHCIECEFDENTIINLLSISHFHQDHINGIKKLLSQVKRVETIILPYVTPRDRLIYLLSLRNSGDESGWVEQFIIDPINTLIDGTNGEKIGNIVYIYGGDTELKEFEYNDSPELYPTQENDNFKFDITELVASEDEPKIKSEENITDRKVSVKKHGRINLRNHHSIPFWQFVFYYCNPSKTRKYIDQLIVELKIKNDIIDKKVLHDIIEKKIPQTITKKIRMSNSEINNTLSFSISFSVIQKDRIKLISLGFGLLRGTIHLFKNRDRGKLH